MAAVSTQTTKTSPLRYLRAPFMLISLLVGFVLMMYLLCSVEIGAWVEDVLRRLGAKDIPGAVMIVSGVGLYTALAIALPLALLLMGFSWWWMLLIPLVVTGAIILIGRW